MSMDRLMVFAAVAKHRNVSRAAEQLHISQPAVSKQLKLLEKDYNAKLYKRTDRGIELTETGEIFIRGVKAILKGYERLREKIRAAPSTARIETLAVGGTYSPSLYLLPSLLALFQRTHPHVQCTLRSETKFAIERMIVNSEVDIGLIYAASQNPAIVAEPYRPEPLVAFVSRNHPLARNQELTLQKLDRVPLIVRKAWRASNTIELLLREMEKKGLHPNVALRCESPEAVKTAVRRKMGAGILYKDTIDPEVRRGEFKILKLPVKNFESRSFILYRKDRPLSANARDFLTLLRRAHPRPIRDQRRKKHRDKVTERTPTSSNQGEFGARSRS
ncbi:MAG: LysR family transcriptional regulator [Deltaproteobacteria bacterium]|nr:LysR family transcriptional regulator [Deltaproteobacteria bacterium]